MTMLPHVLKVAPLRYAVADSPLGGLLLLGRGAALCGLYMQAGERPVALQPGWSHAPDAFPTVRRQLEEYFAGRRTSFDLRLETTGTPFQRSVWQALQEIPYGQTMSYVELARELDRPTAARAVGAANGANPISIIVPCHRLVGANGALTGYAGGLERKRSLLDLEAGLGTSRRRV